MALFPRSIEKPFNRVCDVLGRAAGRMNISPNTISTLGFAVTCVAGVLFYAGEFVWAGVCVLISGMLDAIDGRVARLTNTASIYGAVYDAVLDRSGEMALYAGLTLYLIRRDLFLTAGVAVVAVSASFLISYVRARAESFNVPCRVGMLRRSERIVLLGLGSLFHFAGGIFHEPSRWIISQFNLVYKYPPMPITLVLLIIAVLAPVTVLQRLHHVRAVTSSGRIDSREVTILS